MSMTNLYFVQQEMIRYGMSIYFILGIIGNIFNCIIFTRPHYRRSASSIYFLAFSVFAIFYLILSIGRYFHALNSVDLQTHSIIFCKTRLYVTHVLGQYLRFCVVFVCVDRFLATRAGTRILLVNSIASAKKLLLLMTIVCPLIAIHLPILMEIRNNVCSQFGVYKLAYAIYQLIIVGIAPPVLMSVFSVLAIRSLQRRHSGRERAKQRDRHLMKMVIVEVILHIVISIPYSINLLYAALTYSISKSIEQIEIELFVSFLTTFSIYLISVMPFYLFLLTSTLFRKEFFSLFLKYYHRRILPTIF